MGHQKLDIILENKAIQISKYQNVRTYKKNLLVNRYVLNILNSVERGLASTPLFIIPGFSLHFPKELSYGYLWFEGNGKIPLGRQGKRSLKGRAYREK